jgi:hypothetical protein
VVKVFRGGTATVRQYAKNSNGGYSVADTANIQPAAGQIAVGAPKNLLGKVK